MANNILITRNKGIQKQEILLLEFCKNTQKQKGDQREQTMSTMLTQQSTCFCCWDDLSYGLNTLGPLCLWQCFLHPPQSTAILHPCRQDRHHSSNASSTMCPTPQTHPALHTSSPAQASKQIRNSIVEGIASLPDRSPSPGDSIFQ